MRWLILFCCFTGLFGFSFSGAAQLPELHPSVGEFPQLHPDSLAKLLALQKEFEELMELEISYQECTPHQKHLMENEMLYSRSPLSTAPWGCSWYCASDAMNAQASSTLSPTTSTSYAANQVHDFDLKTAWVEGETGNGEGSRIRIETKATGLLRLTEIIVYNGYCKDLNTWKANGRIKTAKLFINGAPVALLHLEDDYRAQTFEIGSFAGKDGYVLVELAIIDVYPGEMYADTALSEINFEGTGHH